MNLQLTVYCFSCSPVSTNEPSSECEIINWAIQSSVSTCWVSRRKPLCQVSRRQVALSIRRRQNKKKKMTTDRFITVSDLPQEHAAGRQQQGERAMEITTTCCTGAPDKTNRDKWSSLPNRVHRLSIWATRPDRANAPKTLSKETDGRIGICGNCRWAHIYYNLTSTEALTSVCARNRGKYALSEYSKFESVGSISESEQSKGNHLYELWQKMWPISESPMVIWTNTSWRVRGQLAGPQRVALTLGLREITDATPFLAPPPFRCNVVRMSAKKKKWSNSIEWGAIDVLTVRSRAWPVVIKTPTTQINWRDYFNQDCSPLDKGLLVDDQVKLVWMVGKRKIVPAKPKVIKFNKVGIGWWNLTKFLKSPMVLIILLSSWYSR